VPISGNKEPIFTLPRKLKSRRSSYRGSGSAELGMYCYRLGIIAGVLK